MAQKEYSNGDYVLYKELKERFDIIYKGYNLQNLIGHNIARLIYHKKLPLIKSLFRWFIIPHQKYFKTYFNNEGILVSNIYPQRKDHTAFVSMISEEIECKNPIMNFTYGKKIKIVLNLRNIFSSISFILKNIGVFNFKEAIYFGATLTYIKNYLDLLEKYVKKDIKISKYIASNVSNIPECIIAQFLKKQKILVYSIQHGIYTLYKHRIAYDIINIENLSDNILLCWGQATIDQANEFGIDTSNWIITGNPKYKSVKIGNIKQSFKTCIVLLGRYIYNKENLELIKVLNEYSQKSGVNFEVKPHPSLDMRLYKTVLKEYGFKLIEKDELLSDLFISGRYDFAITYNTSAYYDPIMYGIPSLRFSLNENEIYFGLNDRFQNIYELEEVIKWFKSKDENELVKRYTDIMEYVFGCQNINYKQFV